MANEFNSVDDLPDPLPTDAIAIAIRGGKLVLYIESTGRMTGYRLDIVDGFNLAYLMLGATLQCMRELGSKATIPEREAFEAFLGDLEVDLDKPLDESRGDNAEPPGLEFA